MPRMPLPSEPLRRIAASFALLTLLCACGVIPNPFAPAAPPAPLTPTPLPPPPAAPPPPPAPMPMPPVGGSGLPIPGMGGLPIPSIPGLGGIPIPTLPGGAGGLPIPPMPGGVPVLPPGMTIPTGGSLLSTDPPPDYATLAAPPRGSTDGSGHMTDAFLREETEALYHELVRALSAEHRARVEHIPFHFVEDAMEPNAAAGCAAGSSAPMVMVTSSMLTMAAAAAESRAYDELGSTNTYETYAGSVLGALSSGRPVPGVAPGSISGALATDARKLARQRHLFDEQLAFILGHELAHHYRGHTGCAGRAPATREEAEAFQRMLSTTVPPLEQPFEIEADAWGTTTVLEVGHDREGGHWSEEGGLLSLDLFGHLSTTDLRSIFLSTHPPAAIRAPIVRHVADSWAPGRAPIMSPEIDARGVTIDLGSGPITIPVPIPH